MRCSKHVLKGQVHNLDRPLLTLSICTRAGGLKNRTSKLWELDRAKQWGRRLPAAPQQVRWERAGTNRMYIQKYICYIYVYTCTVINFVAVSERRCRKRWNEVNRRWRLLQTAFHLQDTDAHRASTRSNILFEYDMYLGHVSVTNALQLILILLIICKCMQVECKRRVLSSSMFRKSALYGSIWWDLDLLERRAVCLSFFHRRCKML